MSFSNEVKEELAQVEPGCSHCLRATLAALVRVNGSLYLVGKGKHRLEIDTDSLPTANLIQNYFQQLYELEIAITIRRNVLHKSLNYLISIPPQHELEYALVDMGVLAEDGGLEMGLAPKLVKKQCCSAAYLRGAFIGNGFIADPSGRAHFELSFVLEEIANDVAKLFHEKGINVKVMKRRNNFVVYLKSGDAITEFLAYTQAYKAAMEYEEQRVIKSVRNDTNRKTNAEIANMQKAVDASLRSCECIMKLQEQGRISSLPAALREIAYLRLQYPAASLSELGQHANPPLSKSAVAHRVHRLEQVALTLKR